MNPWRVVGAIFVFLACLVAGTFGGCTVGFMTAYSVASSNPNSGLDGVLMWGLLGFGALVGIVLGVVLARLIIKGGLRPD